MLLSRRAADLSDLQLTRTVMDQLSAVEQAYWDLVYATRNLDVVTKALAQARAQVSSNERQVQSGTLAPIDVVEAQTQVVDLRAGARDRAAGADRVGEPAEAAGARQPRRVALERRARAERPADRPVPELSLDAGRADGARQPAGAARRSTSRSSRTRSTSGTTRTRRGRRSTWSAATRSRASAGTATTNSSPLRTSTDPAVVERLDELSALAGLDPVVLTPSTTVPLPDFLVGGFGDSLANIGARRFPVALVQVQLGIPIRNRTAQAQVARTRISPALDPGREAAGRTGDRG